jgi:hypothetical protein
MDYRFWEFYRFVAARCMPESPGLNGEIAARDVEIIAALLAGARASERGESPIRAGNHRVGGHPLTLDSSYMAYLEKHG